MRSSFITWHPHCRRSDSFAAALRGKSHLIHYLEFKRPWLAPLKYPLQTLVTFFRLCTDKPDLVLVATPPVFAALVVYVYARIRGVPFMIDAHTGTFDDPRWTWLLPLSRWLSRSATATIVTSQHLASIVESWDARAIVVGTIPITFPPVQAMALGEGPNIVGITTFSRDEPIEEVVEAARRIPDIILYITGDLRRAPRSMRATAPPNVHFTGWLTEEEYTGLLKAASAIMVLTTHDHTMQRGAYEAMALEKPLITSNWLLLRQTFSKGTIYVDNTTAGIAAGLQAMARDYKKLAVDMKELRRERNSEFTSQLESLLAVVHHRNFARPLGSKGETTQR